MDTMNNKDIHIKINDKEHKGLRVVAIKEKWSMCQVGQEAIKFYLRARKILKE